MGRTDYPLPTPVPAVNARKSRWIYANRQSVHVIRESPFCLSGKQRVYFRAFIGDMLMKSRHMRSTHDQCQIRFCFPESAGQIICRAGAGRCTGYANEIRAFIKDGINGILDTVSQGRAVNDDRLMSALPQDGREITYPQRRQYAFPHCRFTPPGVPQIERCYDQDNPHLKP